MQEVIDNILELDIKKDIDIWEENRLIPLLMSKRWEYYDDAVPFEDTIVLDMKPYLYKNNPFHFLMVGRTGRQKTRIVKNIIKFLYRYGYKILVIEPKALEMYHARYMGKGTRLAQEDKNEKLPVVSYTPAAYYDYARRILPEKDFKKLNFYSLDLSVLDDREIWMSFGCGEKAADIIVATINKGNPTIDKIKGNIARANIMPNTKIASIGAIDNLEGSGTFSKKFKPIPLEKEWEKGNLVTIDYLAKPGKYMNTDIGLMTVLVKNIGQMEGDKVTKKIIIYDDAFFYGGAMAYKLANSNYSYAVNEMGNVQYNYRKFGIDSIVIIQNLDDASIVPTLIEGREDFLITKTGSSEKLRNIIPYDAYMLATNTNPMKGRLLYTNKSSYYFEWIYCNADGGWASGYPFDCTVGHPSK